MSCELKKNKTWYIADPSPITEFYCDTHYCYVRVAGVRKPKKCSEADKERKSKK